MTPQQLKTVVLCVAFNGLCPLVYASEVENSGNAARTSAATAFIPQIAVDLLDHSLALQRANSYEPAVLAAVLQGRLEAPGVTATQRAAGAILLHAFPQSAREVGYSAPKLFYGVTHQGEPLTPQIKVNSEGLASHLGSPEHAPVFSGALHSLRSALAQEGLDPQSPHPQLADYSAMLDRFFAGMTYAPSSGSGGVAPQFGSAMPEGKQLLGHPTEHLFFQGRIFDRAKIAQRLSIANPKRFVMFDLDRTLGYWEGGYFILRKWIERELTRLREHYGYGLGIWTSSPQEEVVAAFNSAPQLRAHFTEHESIIAQKNYAPQGPIRMDPMFGTEYSPYSEQELAEIEYAYSMFPSVAPPGIVAAYEKPPKDIGLFPHVALLVDDSNMSAWFPWLSPSFNSLLVRDMSSDQLQAYYGALLRKQRRPTTTTYIPANPNDSRGLADHIHALIQMGPDRSDPERHLYRPPTSDAGP